MLLEEVAALEEQGWVRGRYFTEEVRKVLQKIGRENGKKARRKTKLDWGKVREIRRLRETQGLTHQSLADRFGVSRNRITLIVNNKSWIE